MKRTTPLPEVSTAVAELAIVARRAERASIIDWLKTRSARWREQAAGADSRLFYANHNTMSFALEIVIADLENNCEP